MSPFPRSNADTRAVRRNAKRRRASNDHWMHLTATKVSSRTIIQRGWALTNRAMARTTYFTAAMLAIRQALFHAEFERAWDTDPWETSSPRHSRETKCW